MREAGQRAGSVLLTWTACAVLLAAAVVLGRGAASGVNDEVLAIALAFAGGAVLASLADTLMPEAFEHGGPLNAFATAAGFFLSFILAG
jgi:ZIP family zinc transporter